MLTGKQKRFLRHEAHHLNVEEIRRLFYKKRYEIWNSQPNSKKVSEQNKRFEQ